MKQKYLDILTALGFELEYDQFDIPKKNWMRFRHPLSTDDKEFALIIYGDQSLEDNLERTSNMLIKIGKYLKVQEFHSFQF